MAAFDNRSMPHFTDGHSLCTTPCMCSANVCGAFVQWARPEPSFQFAAPCWTTTQGYIKILVLNCSCCSCCLHVDCAVDSMGLQQHYTSLVLLALARHRVLPHGPLGKSRRHFARCCSPCTVMRPAWSEDVCVYYQGVSICIAGCVLTQAGVRVLCGNAFAMLYLLGGSVYFCSLHAPVVFRGQLPCWHPAATGQLCVPNSVVSWSVTESPGGLLSSRHSQLSPMFGAQQLLERGWSSCFSAAAHDGLSWDACFQLLIVL